MVVRMWILFSLPALMLLSGRWTFMLTVITFKWIMFFSNSLSQEKMLEPLFKPPRSVKRQTSKIFKFRYLGEGIH